MNNLYFEATGVEECHKALYAATAAGCHTYIPSAFTKSCEYWIPVVETVFLSNNPNVGDVYKGSKDGFVRISHQGLAKLERTAGVEWEPDATCRTDDRGDKLYISFKAVGGTRKADGKLYFLKSEYDLDLEVIEEEIRDGHERKRNNKFNKGKSDQEFAEYVDFCTKRDFRQKRKHKLKLAETGAKDRVVRVLLGIKSEYRAADLEKPWVIVRFVMDHSNPEVKQVFFQTAAAAINGIYGGGGPPQLGAGPNPADGAIDIPHADPADGQPGPEDSTTEMNGQEADFQAQDEEGQARTIEALCQQKGHAPIDTTGFGPEKMLDCFRYLLNYTLEGRTT